MLQKISLVGSGAAGNKIVAEGTEKEFNTIAMNSTEIDIEGIKDKVDSVMLLSKEGCGKIRKNGKDLIKTTGKKVVEQIDSETHESNIIVCMGALGGGTGSGSLPITSDLVNKMTKKLTIPLGVLPSDSEDIRSFSNSVEACKEIEGLGLPYILIDNNMYKGSPIKLYSEINKSIIEDMTILRGDYNTPSEYSNMDVKDCNRLFGTPGLLSINKISGIKETDLDNETYDSLMIRAIKESYNVQLEKDGIIKRMGIILNVTEGMYNKYNGELPELKKEVGTPIETFTHVNIIDDASKSSIIVILAGMSFPDSAIEEMVSKIEEAKEALTKKKESKIEEMNDSVSWLESGEDEDKDTKINNIDDIIGNW